MSDNKYRQYLSGNDQSFYRQYLKSEDEPVGSSFFGKLITGAAATVGLAAGTAAAYRSGAFRGAMERAIEHMGNFRQTRVGNTLDSIRNWTNDDAWGDIPTIESRAERLFARASMLRKLPDYLVDGDTSRLVRQIRTIDNPIIQDKPFELLSYVKQMESVLAAQRKEINSIEGNVNLKAKKVRFHKASEQAMEEALRHVMTFNKEQQDNLLKRTGYRQSTVGDVFQYLPDDIRKQLQEFQKKHKVNLMDKVIDQNIMIKPNGHQPVFADLRDFRDAIAKMGDTLANDFTTPFIKINPLRMFYLNEFTKNKTPILFANMGKSRIQPYVERNLPIGDSLFINGKMHTYNHDTQTFDVLNTPGYLVNARNEGRGSLLARNTRNMMDLYKQEFVPSEGWGWTGGKFGFRKSIWEPIAKFIDFGFQNERIHQDPALGDVAVVGSWIGRKLHYGFFGWKGAKPYKEKFTVESPFGNGAEWLFIPRYKTLDEVNQAGGGVKDYFKQFFAARNNPEDVTTASFFAYTFAERLNATLNQMGFGLSAKHLGSAPQILWQLSLRRALPVALGIEAIKGTNALWEQVTGDEYEDQFWGAFTRSQEDMAQAAQALGITDWAKQTKKLMPGFEFLSELPVPVITTEGMTPIPIKDLLPLDKTADELKDYYANGVEPVRKGRYWETGNTDLVGSSVSYYQPNWYRRITSDWEYTDNMWGSKAEYWKYNPKFPILDPYHWEKKHYEDRPYQLTGGIPAIEEFPLIGHALNSTIGQLIKPQMAMHSEEWNNPGYYDKLPGFQIARNLGIIESNIGGATTSGGILGAHTGSASSGVAQAAATVQSTYGSPTVGYNPAQGANGIVGGENLAYVTSSGHVSIMQADRTTNMYQLNQMLKTTGIKKSGAASDIWTNDFDTLLSSSTPEALANPAGVNMALENFHYNMTEMGGFYGWISTMVANPNSNGAQYQPIIQTSSKAYGFNRQFWDQDYGNMGFDAMEIFRRFVPRDQHKNYVDTLDNNMPTWIPGADYFTDYQHGDPYVKIKKGELRLPGQAYERIWGIEDDVNQAMKLDIGGSFIGYDEQTIINHWLHRDDIKDAAFNDILDQGTDLHKQIEAAFAAQGVSISSEQYVEDKKHGISGFYDIYAHGKNLMEWALQNAADIKYYRAAPGGGNDEYQGYFLSPEDVDANTAASIVANSPNITVDLKTRSQNQYDRDELHFENAQQLNFYGTQLHTNINAIVDINRDDPNAKPHVFFFDTNPQLYGMTTAKIEEARAAVRQMLKDGAIGRGDLYNIVDRYRILADVAPYSAEFRKLKAQISLANLSDEDKKKIQDINHQLAQRKDFVPTFDYRFKTANVKNMTVTVTKVINNNMFLTKEFSNNPIRLAGVYVPSGHDAAGNAARDFVGQYIKPGHKLSIAINADKMNQVNNDTYKSISAVVHAGDIRNLNRELIKRGLAKEKENDYSATGVRARFSDAQIAFGSAWETIAHLDTPFNSKLLHVASPLEEYERRQVYGKDFQSWNNPIQDFAIPWYQNWISKSPVAALTIGTFMGSLFGTNRYGRIMGAMIGATATAIGVGYTHAYHAATGETWVPKRRQREWEINEYFDMLKYVKYRALFEEASDEAMKREHFDVRAYMKRNQMSGDTRKQELHALKQKKRDLLRKTGTTKSPEMKALNKKIEAITNTRHAERISPIAAQAIQYYQESERTMYAYDAGDPLENILSALPRKDRLYINKFMEAPEEERGRILQVVPDYVRRVLEGAWGMKVEDKPDIYQYFTHHDLPNENWLGWDPRANLDDIKLRVVKHEGMDMGEFNLWPEDEIRANHIQEDQIPDMIQPTHINVVKRRLHSILGEAGFRDLNIDVQATKERGIHMSMNVRKDRRDEVISQLNDNGYSLI